MSPFKRTMARLLGLDREIEDLRRQVHALSWNPDFGMWTREAFLQFCEVMPRQKRILAFIDLDGIHALNEELGYEEVNTRIKSTFSIYFRRSDIVARWFSGDEIVILFDTDRAGAERKVEELRESARKHGLTFQYAIGEWAVGLQAIESVIAELGADVAQQKAGRSR